MATDNQIGFGAGGETPTEEPRLTAADVTIGGILGEAWGVYKENFGLILVGFLIYVIAAAIAGNVPVLPLFVIPHILTGYYIMILKAVRKQDPEVGDLFKGFGLYVPVLLANIIIALLVVLGLILLIVPGIILALMYALTFFLLAEYTLAVERGEMQKSAVAAWTTCKRSAEMMNGWKLKFFLYGIVLGLVALSGVLMLGIGLLFTAPLAIMSTVVLYEKIRRIGPLA